MAKVKYHASDTLKLHTLPNLSKFIFRKIIYFNVITTTAMCKHHPGNTLCNSHEWSNLILCQSIK